MGESRSDPRSAIGQDQSGLVQKRSKLGQIEANVPRNGHNCKGRNLEFVRIFGQKRLHGGMPHRLRSSIACKTARVSVNNQPRGLAIRNFAPTVLVLVLALGP